MSAAKTAAEKTTAKPAKAKAARKPEAREITPADYRVILSPVITEKATNGSQYNQVTFRVHRNATKPVIRTAIENLFKVKVTAVNTHNRKGKTKRFKGRLGYRSDVKFAVVTLAEGSKIDITTGL
jgi:large subunit ribosomal protein L23